VQETAAAIPVRLNRGSPLMMDGRRMLRRSRGTGTPETADAHARAWRRMAERLIRCPLPANTWSDARSSRHLRDAITWGRFEAFHDTVNAATNRQFAGDGRTDR
jgi:hypothetical protein